MLENANLFYVLMCELIYNSEQEADLNTDKQCSVYHLANILHAVFIIICTEKLRKTEYLKNYHNSRIATADIFYSINIRCILMHHEYH